MGREEVERWAAFVRGINVGGHAILPMDRLRRIIEQMGFEKVRTVRATGNVVIEPRAHREPPEAGRIGRALSAEVGRPIQLALRRWGAIEALVKADPFHPGRGDPWTPYVTFLAEVPRTRPGLPLRSPSGHIEVFGQRSLDVLSWCRREGRSPGFPNELVEKSFGVPATTRNWSTVVALRNLVAADS